MISIAIPIISIAIIGGCYIVRVVCWRGIRVVTVGIYDRRYISIIITRYRVVCVICGRPIIVPRRHVRVICGWTIYIRGSSVVSVCNGWAVVIPVGPVAITVVAKAVIINWGAHVTRVSGSIAWGVIGVMCHQVPPFVPRGCQA